MGIIGMIPSFIKSCMQEPIALGLISSDQRKKLYCFRATQRGISPSQSLFMRPFARLGFLLDDAEDHVLFSVVNAMPRGAVRDKGTPRSSFRVTRGLIGGVCSDMLLLRDDENCFYSKIWNVDLRSIEI